MLRIRLQRIGRKNLPAYRVVVAEKSQAVKKKYIDLVGHYLPSQNPKVLEVDQDKIKEWIAKGAQPTDTVASLLKGLGMDGMDKYIGRRDKQRKKKNAPEEEEAPAEAPAAEETASEEAPVEETPAETPAEEPAQEEPKVEETPAEEAPAEEPKEEESAEEQSE